MRAVKLVLLEKRLLFLTAPSVGYLICLMLKLRHIYSAVKLSSGLNDLLLYN